jgi:hypothetical protein
MSPNPLTRKCRTPAGMDEAIAWECQTCHEWVYEYDPGAPRPCEVPEPAPSEQIEVWVRLLEPGDRIVERPYVNGMVWLVVVDRPAPLSASTGEPQEVTPE